MRDEQTVTGEIEQQVRELGALAANYHAAAQRVHARLATLSEEAAVLRLQRAEATARELMRLRAAEAVAAGERASETNEEDDK